MENNNLKAVSASGDELRIENYIVLFGGKDLTGEFFTKSTSLNSNYTQTGLLYVDFEHGIDSDKLGNSADNVLGYVDWSTAKTDERGVFVQRVLNRRAQYVKYLEDMIDAGIVGTSSQAVTGKVSKKSGGEIVDWPLMRDSLTVTPAEPRMIGENVLLSAKSLYEFFPYSKSLSIITGLESKDIITAKSIDEIENLRDVERFLRDSGLSKRESVAIISRVKSLARSDSEVDELAPLIEAMKGYQLPTITRV